MEDEYKRSGGRKKRQAAIPMKKWPQNTVREKLPAMFQISFLDILLFLQRQ